jgi:hypothetical protein
MNIPDKQHYPDLPILSKLDRDPNQCVSMRIRVWHLVRLWHHYNLNFYIKNSKPVVQVEYLKTTPITPTSNRLLELYMYIPLQKEKQLSARSQTFKTKTENHLSSRS